MISSTLGKPGGRHTAAAAVSELCTLAYLVRTTFQEARDMWTVGGNGVCQMRGNFPGRLGGGRVHGQGLPQFPRFTGVARLGA